jgi:hypothetical protein
LTPFGEDFLRDVRPRYESLHSTYHEARLAHLKHDELVLGHTPELGHLLFPRLLDGRADLDAEVRPAFTPRLLHTHDQLTALTEGTIDMGLCWEPDPGRLLDSTILARCPFVAILRVDDPLLAQPRLELGDLRGRRLLMIPRADNRFIEKRVDASLVAAGMNASCLDEVARYDELAIQVASRSSIGVHPATVLLTNTVPGLAFRELHDPDLDIAISVATRKNPGDAIARLTTSLRAIALEALDDVMQLLDGEERGLGTSHGDPSDSGDF